jgi:regulator of sigma E protease
LDGGKLVFLVVEMVFRKRLISHRIEAVISFAGFVLLIGLIVIISFKDVLRLF